MHELAFCCGSTSGNISNQREHGEDIREEMEDMPDYMIELRSVTKRYGNIVANDHINPGCRVTEIQELGEAEAGGV